MVKFLSLFIVSMWVLSLIGNAVYRPGALVLAILFFVALGWVLMKIDRRK